MRRTIVDEGRHVADAVGWVGAEDRVVRMVVDPIKAVRGRRSVCASERCHQCAQPWLGPGEIASGVWRTVSVFVARHASGALAVHVLPVCPQPFSSAICRISQEQSTAQKSPSRTVEIKHLVVSAWDVRRVDDAGLRVAAGLPGHLAQRLHRGAHGVRLARAVRARQHHARLRASSAHKAQVGACPLNSVRTVGVADAKRGGALVPHGEAAAVRARQHRPVDLPAQTASGRAAHSWPHSARRAG